jgi:hypothetical protein
MCSRCQKLNLSLCNRDAVAETLGTLHSMSSFSFEVIFGAVEMRLFSSFSCWNKALRNAHGKNKCHIYIQKEAKLHPPPNSKYELQTTIKTTCIPKLIILVFLNEIMQTDKKGHHRQDFHCIQCCLYFNAESKYCGNIFIK